MPVINQSRPFDYDRLTGHLFEDVLDILGSTGVILPLADKHHGALTDTQTTIGNEQLDFTMSAALSSFATPPKYNGAVPSVQFNGTSENGESPDNTFWTRSLLAGSWGAWINLVDDASLDIILAKYDATSGAEAREWRFYQDTSDRLVIELWDETANAAIGRRQAAALSHLTWIFVVATYDGGAPSSSLKLSVNGVQVDDTDQNTGVFTTMQNTATVVTIGSEQGTAAVEGFLNGQIAGGALGPIYTQKELSLDEIKRLYNIGRRALGV